MDHPEVELAIAIVIEPTGSHGPLAARDSGLGGDVFKRAVTAIAVEQVAVDAGDEEVGVSVVVKIADGSAHGISRSGHAGLLGDIAELPIALVAIQAIPILGG